MPVAKIFNFNGLTMAEIERVEHRRALQRTPTQQLRYLTELIELSASLRQPAYRTGGQPTAKSQQP